MEVPRFDHLWHETIKQHGIMVKHSNGMRTALRLYRKAAYRFTASLLLIRQHHHNEFLRQLGGRDVDAWMDEHFEVLEQLGEDRRKIMRAIEDGMTEKEYIHDGLVWVVRKRIAAPRSTAQVDVNVEAPAKSLSDADQIAELTTWRNAAKSELVQLRRDNAVLLREVDMLRKSIERMEKTILATKRKAG